MKTLAVFTSLTVKRDDESYEGRASLVNSTGGMG